MRAARLVTIGLVLATACRRPADDERLAKGAQVRLVFKHQPLGGDPSAFERILDRYRAAHPDVELVTELLPNNSDVAHQYFLTALEGGAQDFDVLVADVIWVPEFARAGWVSDLSDVFPPDRIRAEFLAGPAEAVTWSGRTWAVPWYVDVGMLYYRTDLVPRPPRTYAELEQLARDAMERQPGIAGFVWQGRQYEGLVCVVYEAIWGHGGESLRDDALVLDAAPHRDALAYLRRLLASGISPQAVASANEEEARRAFQEGRAAMMRNWPYAWELGQARDSAIRGRFAIAPLPSLDGRPGPGTLGGWQLAVNAASPPERRRAAIALIEHLTSARTNLEMAFAFGRNPPRASVYDDPELRARVPFMAQLRQIIADARPRPVTPYYSLLSDVLQGEFSAAVNGVRSPEAALHRAQTRADQIIGAAE